MTDSRMAFAATFAALVLSAGFARAEDAVPDLTLRAPPDVGGNAAAPPAAIVEGAPEDGMTGAAVPFGFYRDRQGRVMQVSFDFGRRLWLGVGYAPRRTPVGQTEISPAAFDFGVAFDRLSEDG